MLGANISGYTYFGLARVGYLVGWSTLAKPS
jgi:hypothetical protein